MYVYKYNNGLYLNSPSINYKFPIYVKFYNLDFPMLRFVKKSFSKKKLIDWLLRTQNIERISMFLSFFFAFSTATHNIFHHLFMKMIFFKNRLFENII